MADQGGKRKNMGLDSVLLLGSGKCGTLDWWQKFVVDCIFGIPSRVPIFDYLKKKSNDHNF